MTSSNRDGLVEPIRNVSRQLVRELGFMISTLARTSHPPSGVHALIEIGGGTTVTEKSLCETLQFEKTSVQPLIETLFNIGEVKSNAKAGDEAVLSLTAKGERTLTSINMFARDQVLRALESIPDRDAQTILLGLEKYAASLSSQRTGQMQKTSPVEVVRGYQPGLIGRALEVHLDFYSKHHGFGAFFEASLAKGLDDLISRIDHDRNEAWTARYQDKIVGTLFIDGEDLGENRAHLRAFIVDSNVRGGGAGRRLLAEAIKFVDEQQFEETHLWTFQGLDAARRLYESFDFVLKEQATGKQWGKEVTEQLFVRKLPR